MDSRLYILRGKCLITMSIAMIMIIFGIEYQKYLDNKKNDYTYNIESINVKDMALASKKEIDSKVTPLSNIEEVKEEIEIKEEEPVRNWYMPVKQGSISGDINYYHTAVDIVSPNGIYEEIYPIANGTISNIYTDYAGALIVTISHNIDNINYTSMYVHLSKYAYDLYIGKEVNVNDIIGYMGQTGIASGVHLHLAVTDCILGDDNCKDINSLLNYQKIRYQQGFRGIYSIMDISNNWTER